MDSDQSTTKILFLLLYSLEVGEERTVTSRVEVGGERTVTSPPQKYCFRCFIL